MPARVWHRVYKEANFETAQLFLLSKRKHVWNKFRGKQHVWQRSVRFIGRHNGSRGRFCIHARQWYLSIQLFSFFHCRVLLSLTSRVAFIISVNIPSSQILIEENEGRRKISNRKLIYFLVCADIWTILHTLIMRAWKNVLLFLCSNLQFVK